MKLCLVSIPRNIQAFFFEETGVLVLINVKTKNRLTLLLAMRVFFVFNRKILITTTLSTVKKTTCPNSRRIETKFNLKTLKLRLKLFMKGSFMKIRLTLAGIGYRFFTFFLGAVCVLQVKLGFSHRVFFKLPKSIEVIFIKATEIIVLGKHYQTLFNMVASIRKLRFPNPYKKKGVFYKNETIVLKQGKTC